MSADRLREAARVLRERAEAATPGPWKRHADGLVWRTDRVPGDPVSGSSEIDDATYIATMHPRVGLALADWLDYEAGRVDTAVDDGWDARIFEPAERIADLILGGAS